MAVAHLVLVRRSRVVSCLWIIRFFTVAVSLLYGVYNIPWSEVAMFLNPALSIIGEGGNPYGIFTVGAVAIYIAALACIIIVFVAIPRWSAGSRILSWSFVLMGLGVLTGLVEGYAVSRLPWHIQITTYAHPLILALPPFILATVLRLPKIEADLRRIG